MTDPIVYLGSGALQVIAGLAIAFGIAWLYRWIRRQSAVAGAIVATAILMRAGFGLLAFWISYLNLSIGAGLHSGDGFWKSIAIDGYWYTVRASNAAQQGLSSIDSASASPAYVRLLAVWMHIVGTAPASGLFLNLLLFTLLCGLVVYTCRPTDAWRTDLPCLSVLAAVSFSPVLMIHGTQPLKDDSFAMMAGAACVGVASLLPGLSGRLSRPGYWRALFGFGLLLLMLYEMAGIRAYYALFMWSGLAAVLVGFSAPWTMRGLTRGLPATAAVLVVAWIACQRGAGPYWTWIDAFVSSAVTGSVLPGDDGVVPDSTELVPDSTGLVPDSTGLVPDSTGVVPDSTGVVPDSTGVVPDSTVLVPDSTGRMAVMRELFTKVQDARTGFISTPGGTNIIPVDAGGVVGGVVDPGEAQTGPAFARERPTNAFGYVKRLAVGLGAMFVPISLLRALSVIQFSGGRGLLLVTDVDTIFLDATILTALFLIVHRWRDARRQLPYVLFVVVVAGVSTLSLGYVVTNFGTLFRLRLMAVIPIWMLALAIQHREPLVEESVASLTT